MSALDQIAAEFAAFAARVTALGNQLDVPGFDAQEFQGAVRDLWGDCFGPAIIAAANEADEAAHAEYSQQVRADRAAYHSRVA